MDLFKSFYLKPRDYFSIFTTIWAKLLVSKEKKWNLDFLEHKLYVTLLTFLKLKKNHRVEKSDLVFKRNHAPLPYSNLLTGKYFMSLIEEDS